MEAKLLVPTNASVPVEVPQLSESFSEWVTTGIYQLRFLETKL